MFEIARVFTKSQTVNANLVSWASFRFLIDTDNASNQVYHSMERGPGNEVA